MVHSATTLMRAYAEARSATERLCAPLETEDYVIQAMTDVSPPKWHLGHTTWFFERVILQEHQKSYRPWDERFYYVFNSYYQSFGDRLRRDIRGTLSRPSVPRVYEYRRAVDDRLNAFVAEGDERVWATIAPLIELGIHHEQQHQELLVTDIKYNFATSPMGASYHAAVRGNSDPHPPITPAFLACPGSRICLGQRKASTQVLRRGLRHHESTGHVW